MLFGLGVVLVLLADVIGLLMIPVGLPGTFVQVGAALAMTVASGGAHLGWGWVAFFLGLALAGELVEFLSGRWGARRFGGSARSGWWALAGGVVGAFVGGIPVPVLGSILMSFVGTFVGALLGEMSARRAVAPDLRVGLGALVGRVAGTASKLAVGFLILIATASVLLAQVFAGAAP